MSNGSLISVSQPDTFAFYVGVSYICTGVIFIPLQLICSHIMRTHSEMRNPTYQLAAHLSIVDAVELIPICIYAGATIIRGVQYVVVERLMSFIVLSAWYANCILLPSTAFTRWVAITKWHAVKSIFTKKTMKLFHLVSWFPMTIYTFYLAIISDSIAFKLYPDLLTFSFDIDTPVGNIVHWIDLGIGLFMVTIDMGFNVASLGYVHKMLRDVQTHTNTENNRRELLLLAQCFIVSCFFALAVFMNPLAIALGWDDRYEFLLTHVVWVLNHCVNPLVYLSVNRLMRRAFIRFISFGKLCGGAVGPVETQKIGGTKGTGRVISSVSTRKIKSVCPTSQNPTTSYL